MNTHNHSEQLLQKLQLQVHCKQQELQELANRIHKAITIQKQYQDSQKSSRNKLLSLNALYKQLRDEIITEKSQINNQIQKYKEYFQLSISTVTEVVYNLQEIYETQKRQYQMRNNEIKLKYQQKQQDNEAASQAIINKQQLLIQQLQKQLQSNDKVEVQHCEFDIQDHIEDSYEGQHKNYQQFRDPIIQHEHENEQLSQDYPRLFFQDQIQQEDNAQYLSCPNTYRIQHYKPNSHKFDQIISSKQKNGNKKNKRKTSKTKILVQNNQNYENNKLVDNCDFVGVIDSKGSGDKFWKNLTNHISTNNNVSHSASEQNRNNIGLKEKQMLMSKIGDFRKMLFLDKGITRFGFKP